MKIKCITVAIEPTDIDYFETRVMVRVSTENVTFHKERIIPNNHFNSLFEIAVNEARDAIKQAVIGDEVAEG